MKSVLTIAGSDSCGGAGIQADLKTILAHGLYGMSAVTALTAQNTLGVTGILQVDADFLAKEIDAVCMDIPPDAVKIGMVASEELMKVIADRLERYHIEQIVVDPVMVATSGARLVSEQGIEAIKRHLLPLATVVTPNIPEAEVLAGMEIHTPDDMILAARIINEHYHCAVLCKGGHRVHDANDLLYQNGAYAWYKGKRIKNDNTHGTGCTLSSAIASNLAKGYSLERSVDKAKTYVSQTLESMLNLGQGSGPLNHGFAIKGEY